MQINKISIIIPVYNEENTVFSILLKIKEVRLLNEIQKEIIIIDDYSNDRTQKNNWKDGLRAIYCI